MQLLNCHDPETTEERYMAVIHCKTAKLFEAAAQLGAVLAGRPERRGTGAGSLRAASGHRVSTDRRCAGLQRFQRRTGQEHRRRPGRRQADPAADSRHAPRHARAEPGSSARPLSTAGWSTSRSLPALLSPPGRWTILRVLPRRRPNRRLPAWRRSADSSPQGCAGRIGPLCGKPPLLKVLPHRGVAQPGRALPSGGRSRRFKSCHPDQIVNCFPGILILVHGQDTFSIY
jgi:hypothetical protein